MLKHKRSKRRWHPVVGHGVKKNYSAYATWDYFYQVAKSRKLSIAELLERAVSLYEINNIPSIKELEEFREDLRGRIKLMQYRIGTTRPSDLDESILDFYREILEESESLLPEKE